MPKNAQVDTRNVVDAYKGMSTQAIKADLAQRAFAYHIAIENYQHDFNIGTIVRNANAFCAAGVHIIGKRQWNKRGAMVTDTYLHVQYHSDADSFVAWASTQGVSIIGIDNIAGSVALGKTTLPKKAALVLGQEGPGLSADMQSHCQSIVAIEQFGSTRSINVGVASGIVMYAWLQQHVF